MTPRSLLLASIALALPSCGPIGAPAPKPGPSNQAVLCCDGVGGIAAYLVSSKVPMVTSICLGDQTLWTGSMKPGASLEIPVADISGGRDVNLQFNPGTVQVACRDAAGLARVPKSSEPASVTFRGGGEGELPQCNQAEGCVCPKCPRPQSGL